MFISNRGLAVVALALTAMASACGKEGTSPTAPRALRTQVFAADSSCAGGCAGAVLAYTGSFNAGVQSVDLGSLQDGVRVYLHSNVLTGGGTVQFVTSEDCSTWTSYDPATELQGTGATLSAEFTQMGFDAPSARCVGVRNSSAMSGTILLWAFGI